MMRRKLTELDSIREADELNWERNHQGIGNRLIASALAAPATSLARSADVTGWVDCSASTIGTRLEFGRIEFFGQHDVVVAGAVRRRDRLGGLLSFYDREAA
jgi:hypothetical protein